MNDVFLEHIRKRRCQYIRGQPVRLTKTGVIVEARKGKNKAKAGSSKKKAQNSKKSGHQKNKGALIEDVGTGEERVLDADVIVFATGYKKPSLDFLPGELFPEGYEARLRLISFWCLPYTLCCIILAPGSLSPEFLNRGLVSPDDKYGVPQCYWDSWALVSSLFHNAVGIKRDILTCVWSKKPHRNMYVCSLLSVTRSVVDHSHLFTYSSDTRILLTLLLDENARPTPKDMKLWVDVLRYIKRGATGGALGFFTYMELSKYFINSEVSTLIHVSHSVAIWLVLFHLFRLDRLQWLFFIMNGWGVYAATTLGGQLR